MTETDRDESYYATGVEVEMDTGTPQRVVFMYAGLPGSGKTTVANLTADHLGGTVLETGDVVRDQAAREIEEITSQTLGEWAAEMRSKYGNAFATERLVGEILRGDREVEYPLHVVGIRHIDEVVELREFATTSFLVLVKASFELRLERLQERARDGEDTFDAPALLERDRRELNDLGAATIMDNDQVDVTMENNYSELEPLESEVARMANDYERFQNHG